jgi:hypothetical protein
MSINTLEPSFSQWRSLNKLVAELELAYMSTDFQIIITFTIQHYLLWTFGFLCYTKRVNYIIFDSFVDLLVKNFI